MPNYSPDIRNGRQNVVIDNMDSGVGNALLLLYSGTKPATGAAITNQVLLAVLIFSKPSGVVNNGVITFSAITRDEKANASGTIGWARVTNSEGNFCMDLTASLNGQGGEVQLPTLDVVEGQPFECSSFVITEGNP